MNGQTDRQIPAKFAQFTAVPASTSKVPIASKVPTHLLTFQSSLIPFVDTTVST